MIEEGDGFPHGANSAEVIAQAEDLMESVVNPVLPDIPIIFRPGIITLCSMAGFDAEQSSQYGEGVSWESAQILEPDNDNICKIATEATIKKFCELEGIKQEFKGSKYRLFGKWKEP
jgi:hypothetical protein